MFNCRSYENHIRRFVYREHLELLFSLVAALLCNDPDAR